ncbi:MAG: 16S rRNA (uracil(1498)-N(3))-methyltransferase [Candidatus Latescibacteria bacterium]|nr:16S rRNA (uracil(1498)-N(3))-methyltransferase [Candidatus Latescibacterota bacterium]
MASFLVDPADVQDDTLVLRGEEAHHLARVRRHRQGEVVEVVDGAGNWYQVRIEALDRDEVRGQILASQQDRGESPVRLTLAAALVKGQRFDFLVEKATELGVATVVPLLSERGVVRPGSGHKPARWEHLARAALKQCGRSCMPFIAAPAALGEVVRAGVADGQQVLLAVPAGGEGLRRCLEDRPAERLILAVGPEGGFSPGEVEEARRLGARIFSWGRRVLRSETAGMALAALVLHEAEHTLEPLTK